MRERVRSAPLVQSGLHVYSRVLSPYSLIDWGWTYWNHSNSYEKIVDEPKTAYVAYAKHMRRRAFRAISHDKWSANVLNTPQWVNTSSNSQSYVSAGELIAGHHELYYLADQSAAAYASAVSKGLAVDYGHYNRWEQVKPTMATRANLGVFLLELRDFKRMWDFIPSKHLLIKGVTARSWEPVRAWYNMVKRSCNDLPGPADFARYINSQHLNYNFGWKPFVSDIMKCWRGMESFEKRLARFQGNAGKELRRRFRDSPRSVNTTEYSNFVENSFWRNMRMWDFKEQHASAFDFSYHIPQYSNEEMRWRAIADTLGLNPGLSTMWAVLPWSFLWDWFINVSGFLKSYENDWLQPWVTLHQGCYSRKLEGSFSWNVKGSDTYGGVVLPGTQVTFSQYIRKVGLPNFSAATDPLDADKIRLGASLLLSLFQR